MLTVNKNLYSILAFAGVLGWHSLASAELTYLSDDSLSKVTGRAGLTIDIETEVTIGEIEYVDAGSMVWKDISLTGIGGGMVDNIRAKVDSAGSGETLATGFSDYAMLANMGYLDATETDVAWAISEYSDGSGGFGKQYDSGDLLIHVTSTDLGGIDFTQPGNPADHATNLENLKNAVDLHYQEGEFGLRSSDGLTETALSRNFSVQAFLGYYDILMKNNGNGMTVSDGTGGKPDNIRLLDSYIGMDLKFRIEDLDIDQTNNATNTFVPREVTTPGLTLRDMRIHNERGKDTEGSFGFASLESKIGAASDILHINNDGTVSYVDGMATYDINVRMDWDLPHISFGDTGTSIGKVWLTDFNIGNTSLVLSAH